MPGSVRVDTACTFRSDDCGRSSPTHWQNGWRLRLAAPTERRLYASGISGVRVSSDSSASFRDAHNFGGKRYGLGSSMVNVHNISVWGTLGSWMLQRG